MSVKNPQQVIDLVKKLRATPTTAHGKWDRIDLKLQLAISAPGPKTQNGVGVWGFDPEGNKVNIDKARDAWVNRNASIDRVASRFLASSAPFNQKYDKIVSVLKDRVPKSYKKYVEHVDGTKRLSRKQLEAILLEGAEGANFDNADYLVQTMIADKNLMKKASDKQAGRFLHEQDVTEQHLSPRGEKLFDAFADGKRVVKRELFKELEEAAVRAGYAHISKQIAQLMIDGVIPGLPKYAAFKLNLKETVDRHGREVTVARAPDPAESHLVYTIKSYHDGLLRWTYGDPSRNDGEGSPTAFRTYMAAMKDAENHAFRRGRWARRP